MNSLRLSGPEEKEEEGMKRRRMGRSSEGVAKAAHQKRKDRCPKKEAVTDWKLFWWESDK